MTDSGVIYCSPLDEDCGILQIDTNTDTVTELNVNLLPEDATFLWESCAVALDGCIYCMPYMADRIMKIDLNNNDAMTSVGNDLGDGEDKYSGTVVGIDGCVYGIPYDSELIIKYDPINDTNLFVEEVADKCFDCTGDIHMLFYFLFCCCHVFCPFLEATNSFDLPMQEGSSSK